MKIILANPRGFCAGVNMAIDSLGACPGVVSALRFMSITKSSTIATSSSDSKSAASSSSIASRISRRTPSFSTVPTASRPLSARPRAERNLHAIDATCPLVTKVHLEAIRFAREGYTILLIGHEGHDEVAGTIGEAPGNIRLVQDERKSRPSIFPRTPRSPI